MNAFPIRCRQFRQVCPAFLACLILSAGLFSEGAEDLLPDITVYAPDLNDHDLVTDGHRELLRFTTTTPNLGEGPLHVVGVGEPLPNGNLLVNQRVFRDDDTWYDRAAGEFEHHPTHRHIHLEAWAVYRLREHLPGGGVGDIVREGEKTSFCLLDSRLVDGSLPGVPSQRVYRTCDGISQGISAGWADVYDRKLYGQNIDIKGLPQGTYWLEVEADPDNHLLERDETNNTSRIVVEIGEPVFIDGPLEVQPNVDGDGGVDLRIGAKRSPRSHRGNNRYDSTGKGRGQILSLVEKRKSYVRFFGSIENEDAHHHHCQFQSTHTRRKLIAVRHFDTTGRARKNITAKVLHSDYLYHLDGGKTGTLESEVRLKRQAKKRTGTGGRVETNLFFRASVPFRKDSTKAKVRFE